MVSQSSPTVLVVDDERHLADLYAAWLGDDYDVRTAYSGPEALDNLGEQVDIVLLDRRMPDLSGDAVLTEIRERGLDCQVAMVTAVEPDFDILDMPFDTYLTKPMSREKLTDAIESLVIRATYDAQTREYFRLASKRAALESELTQVELLDSPEYERLLDDIERLADDLAALTDDFSTRDFEAQFQSLAPGDNAISDSDVQGTRTD